MPSKKIKIEDSTYFGTFRINKKGFPGIKKAVSKAKVHRMRKAGIKEVDCDTACLVKGQKNMGKKLFKRYGMYKSPTAVARLEKAGAPVVLIGSTKTYCPSSFYWFIDNEYLPERNEKWGQNFINTWTDPT